MRFELLILTQRNAVVVGAGLRQPRGEVFVEEAFLQQVMGDVLFGQMITEAAQANHIFAHRAVAHFGLFKQKLFKPDNVKKVALFLAV
ncbi:hypothetical protein D3C81_2110540 [compost metagenome]